MALCRTTSRCSEQKEDSPIGDRAQVKINPFWKGSKNPPLYLYTHWGASNLEGTLVEALKRKVWWGDDTYLARIIFETMIKDDIGSEVDFGIDTVQHGDIWKLIELSDDQKISVFICHGVNPENHKEVWTGTFEEFINYFEGCGELYWESEEKDERDEDEDD